jgi:hypothetical protein
MSLASRRLHSVNPESIRADTDALQWPKIVVVAVAGVADPGVRSSGEHRLLACPFRQLAEKLFEDF